MEEVLSIVNSATNEGGSSVSSIAQIPMTNTVAGVKSTVQGVYMATCVNGTAITTGLANIAAGYGLKAGEVPYARFSNMDAKKSSLAKAVIDDAAASIGATVGPCINIEIGMKSSGKFSLLPSDGEKIAVKIGVPKSFAQDFSDDWHYVVRPELWKAFLVGVFLMTVVTVCIGMAGRSGKYTGILAVLLLMESGLAFCLGEKYIRHFNDMNYYNLKIYQYMEDSEAPFSYLYGGGFSGIDLLQFALQDRKIEVIRAEELDLNGSEEGNNLPQEGFLIVDQGCGQLAEIEQNYTKCAESRAFVLFRIKETDEKDG